MTTQDRSVVRFPLSIRGDNPDFHGMPLSMGKSSALAWHGEPTRPDGLIDDGTPWVDWSSPQAIYLGLHWLANRSRIGCLWMLPATHGGLVTPWDGLSAWAVSAILVSASVLRVANGMHPIRGMVPAWVPSGNGVGAGQGRGKTCWVFDANPNKWQYGWQFWPNGWRHAVRGPETGAAGRRALDSYVLFAGYVLRVPGGLILPSLLVGPAQSPPDTLCL